MAEFIAGRIIKEADKSEAKGQAKYAAYFVKTKLYRNYQSDVDTILEVEGYGYCIVE